VRILYEVTSGSSNEGLILELRDSMDNILVTGVTRWEVNLVPAVQNLTAVRKIWLAIRDGGDGTGL
jgi:hypothetical protein